MVLKMTHPPISCEKSFESSCWRVGTFTNNIPRVSRAVNTISKMLVVTELQILGGSDYGY